MSLECFFNELSLQSMAPSHGLARERLETFARAMVGIQKAASPVALHIPTGFFNVEISPNFRVGHWCENLSVDRELKQLFRSLTTKVPFLGDGLHGDRALGCEVLHCSRPALGMLEAYLNDGIVVSFLSAPEWDCSSLCVDVSELGEDAALLQSQERLKHVSKLEHAAEHKKWIKAKTKETFADHDELWTNRQRKFPRLLFCERVREMLSQFSWNGDEIRQIIKRLEDLNSWCEEFSGRQRDLWLQQPPSKITPESQVTLTRYRDEHTFMCPDGMTRCFSWHVRFTPGAGRIYFEWCDGDEKILIGHIGEHLPTFKNPH